MREVNDEMLMAYADGELQGEEREAVERALAENPELRSELEMHRRLRARVAAHYEPVTSEPVPQRLVAMLEDRGQVIDLEAARERRKLRLGWPQLAALAASFVVGIAAGQIALSPEPSPLAVEDGKMLASGDLARTLQTRLASQQQPAGAETRVGISFEDQDGRFCRTFEASALEGIACREAEGWTIVTAAATAPPSATQYRQAGSNLVMEQAQAMMASEPLDAEEERRALERGWRR
jgi:hypothetical protein